MLIDLVDRVASEAIGAEAHVIAPFEHATDDHGNKYECQECGHTPSSKGRSKLVVSRP